MAKPKKNLKATEEALAKQEVDPKPRKVFELKLTKYELIHLRDMFSVVLPPSMKVSLSEALAEMEGRPLIEAALWSKIAEACGTAEVPIDDEGPDFIVGSTGPAPLGVFRLASEPDEDSEEDSEE